MSISAANSSEDVAANTVTTKFVLMATTTWKRLQLEPEGIHS